MSVVVIATTAFGDRGLGRNNYQYKQTLKQAVNPQYTCDLTATLATKCAVRGKDLKCKNK